MNCKVCAPARSLARLRFALNRWIIKIDIILNVQQNVRVITKQEQLNWRRRWWKKDRMSTRDEIGCSAHTLQLIIDHDINSANQKKNSSSSKRCEPLHCFESICSLISPLHTQPFGAWMLNAFVFFHISDISSFEKSFVRSKPPQPLPPFASNVACKFANVFTFKAQNRRFFPSSCWPIR